MDDHRFDHIVKDKLESLDPVYNEQAWKALDYRLDLLAPLPWYSRWKSLLVASSLGVITLLNIGLLYKVDREQDQLKELVELIKDGEDRASVDTIYLVSENYLGTSFISGADGSNILASSDPTAMYDLLDPLSVYRITAGLEQEKRNDAGSFAQNNQLVLDREQESYLNTQISTVQALDPFDQEYRFNEPEADEMYVRGVVIPPEKRKWDHPIKPRIGLAIGYLIPDPDIGERFITSRQSLLIESPVRRNFHIMTGLSYQEVTYKLDDVDDNNFAANTLLKYPDYGSFSSIPDEIMVDNTMLQIPIYFRYYKPLNHSWSVFAGGGPTIDILLNQKFTYSFLDIENEQLVKFDEVRESDEIDFTLGSISGHMGIEHYFSRRLSAQVELNYQYGVGKIGLEGRTFNSFSVSGGLFYKLNNSNKIR